MTLFNIKPYTFHPIVKRAIDPLNREIPHNCIGIHGILYNPTEFQNIHPGGSVWLEVCKGTDATSLFETMHLNNTLATYNLKKIPSIGTYSIVHSWNYSSYRSISNEILKIFPTSHSRLTSHYKFTIWCMLGIILHINLIFTTEFNLNWMFTLVTSAIVNTVLGGFGHNYLHTLDKKCLALDWNGLSSFEWILEHIISHHCNPNSDHDHDSLSMLPFVDWQNSSFKNILILPIFAIGEIVVSLQGYFGHKCRWYPLYINLSTLEKSPYPLWIQCAPFLFLIRIISHLLFQPFNIAFFSLTASLLIASFYFSYLAHLNHAFQGTKTMDFLCHQLATTRDFKSNKILPNDLLLGLDKQTLHHLFPHIDHSLFTTEIRKLLQKHTKHEAFTQQTFINMNKVMWKRLL